MIIDSLLFAPWQYLFNVFNPETFKNLNDIQTYGDMLVRAFVILFLIIDFKKENLKYVIIACASAIFYPMLGIIIFALLYLEKQYNKADPLN